MKTKTQPSHLTSFFRLAPAVILMALTLFNTTILKAGNGNALAPADSIKKEPPKPTDFPLSVSQKIKLNAYTQERYQYFTDATKVSGFDIRRARLDFKGNIVNDKFAYRLQLDVAGVPKILDAALSYTVSPYFKITAGQIKVLLSSESLLAENVLETINRSQLAEGLVARSKDVIGDQNGRDIGLQVSGAYANKNKVNLVEYYLEILNGAGINVLDNNTDKDFGGRLVLQPIKGLTFGGSYYNGLGIWGTITDGSGNKIPDPSTKKRDRAGGDIAFIRPRYAINTEFLQGIDHTTHKQGYYVQLSGYPVKDKLQLVFRYDNFDPDTDKDENANTQLVFGLTIFPHKYAKFQINYILNQEEGTQVNNDVLAAQFQLGF